MTPPLAGIRAVEVGGFIAGPYCGAQLADLGADVIKVEPPTAGDPLRSMGPRRQGSSAVFEQLNRNKLSLAVDLKKEVGIDLFRRLVRDVDVVIENLRPGAMRSLGASFEDLRKINPRVVYVAISGWGQTGPLSGRPGLDIMAQARGGLMSITGEPAGDPVKVGVPIADLISGIYGALGAVAALRHRDVSGQGQLVDVNLFESVVSLAVWEAAGYFSTGEVPTRQGSAHQSIAPYQAFRAADGWLTVGVATQRQWSAFCAVAGLSSLEHDPAYELPGRRFDNRVQLATLIERALGGATVDQWIERLVEADVPCAPVQGYPQVFDDPHLHARGYFWESTYGTSVPIQQLGSAMTFSATPTLRRASAPALGQDTVRILSHLGLTHVEIEDLAARHIVITG